MANLKDIQYSFMDYLLAEAGTNSFERSEKNQDLGSFITSTAGISHDHRMAIYANAYRMRLKETLESDHEILGLYLGDELFDQLAMGYIKNHPSRFKSLRYFGDALPQYLEQDTFFSQFPIIHDLAKFERRLLATFDAADSSTATLENLQSIPHSQWPNLKITFHPSVQLFSCLSNAVEAWQALKVEQAPQEANYNHHQHWLIWRGFSRLTEFTSISHARFRLIDGFILGNTVAEQCETMLEFFPEEDVALEILGAVQAWLDMGIIRSFIF